MWFPLRPWRLTLGTPIGQEVHFPGQEASAALPPDLDPGGLSSRDSGAPSWAFCWGRHGHPVLSSLHHPMI